MEILQFDDEDKEDDTGEEVMYDVCKAIQDMMEQSRQKGIEKGIEKGIDQSLCIHVTVLMKNMNWTEEMACKALDVTPEEYRAARSKM